MEGKLDRLLVQEKVGGSLVMGRAEGNGSLGGTLRASMTPVFPESWTAHRGQSSSPISSHVTVSFLLPSWSSFSELSEELSVISILAAFAAAYF
jgi:hypothetical protein